MASVALMQGIAAKPQPQTVALSAASFSQTPKAIYFGDVVRALAFSPDGHWLATSSEYDSSITLWNASTGKRERELAGYSADAPGTSREHGEMLKRDFGRYMRAINPHVVHILVFSPDGRRLASVDTEGTVRVWDFQAATLAYSVKLGGEAAFLAYDPEGKVWAGGVVLKGQNSQAKIEIYDAASGKLVRTIPTQRQALLALSLAPDRVLTSLCDDWGEEGGCLKESVHIWKLGSGDLERSYPVEEDANPFDSFSPDGLWMARIGDAGTKVLNLSTGRVKCSFASPYRPIIAVFSPDSREIALTENLGLPGSNYHREVIELRSSATCAVIGTLNAEGNSESSWGLSQVAFTADGKRLAAAPYTFESIDMTTGTITNTRLIKIWELSTGREFLTLGGQNPN